MQAARRDEKRLRGLRRQITLRKKRVQTNLYYVNTSASVAEILTYTNAKFGIFK